MTLIKRTLSALSIALLVGGGAVAQTTTTTDDERNRTRTETSVETTTERDVDIDVDRTTTERSELPRTASPFPLVGLAGMLSLAGAITLRRVAGRRIG